MILSNYFIKISSSRLHFVFVVTFAYFQLAIILLSDDLLVLKQLVTQFNKMWLAGHTHYGSCTMYEALHVIILCQ